MRSDCKITTVIIITIFFIYIYFFTKHLTLTPAGAESDSTQQRTAPSQAKVTDLNYSDHSTTLKEMAMWQALARLHLTRIQHPTLRYNMV